MRNSMFRKGIVLGIIVLFVGASVISVCDAQLVQINTDPISTVRQSESVDENIATIFSSEISNYTAIMFFIGRIDDLFIDEYQTSFIAVNLWIIGYENDNGSISSYILHTKSETKRFYISNYYDFKGFLTLRFICGIYQIIPEEPSNTILSMNIFSKNDDLNQIVWLVSGIEGAALKSNDWLWILLDQTGQNDTNATCEFHDHDNNSYVNPGDTFTVTAGADGYYVFMLTHKISGATIYKSSLTHY